MYAFSVNMAAALANWRAGAGVFAKRLLTTNRPVQDARCFISMSQSIQSPDAPKRPPGPFAKFIKEKCSEIQKNNPDANGPEITKIASQLWHELGQEEKSARKLLAQEEYQDYKQKYLMFLDGLSEQEKVQLRPKFVKEAPVNKLKNKILLKLGKPKMPLTAYSLFVKSAQLKRGDTSMAQYNKGLADKWHNITKEEREIYEEDARVRKEKYKKELEEWEEKMKATGFKDVIGISSRNKPYITSVSKLPKKSSSSGKKAKDNLDITSIQKKDGKKSHISGKLETDS